MKIVAICETCARLFYRTPGKFCDVPRCQGWVHHVASDPGSRALPRKDQS